MSSEGFVPFTITQAFELLKKGNDRSVQILKHSDKEYHPQREQHPFAAVICCSDSRYPPELIFKNRAGEIFVVRTAGQVLSDEVIGSIEYAVDHLEVPLVVVLGHDGCGAVTSAVQLYGGDPPVEIPENEHGEGSYIFSIMKQIRPAVETSKHLPGDESLLEKAIRENIRNIVNRLKNDIPVLKERVDQGKLIIIGAQAARTTYAVEWFDKPPFDPGACYLPSNELWGFVKIPAGKFLMGSHSWGNHQQHEVELPDYYIGQYPVIKAQFQAFLDATEYQPEDIHCLDGLHYRPITRITRHEALKYCEWLTQELKQRSDTPEELAETLRQGWVVTLPSEAEWEKAARGNDGRTYPWGNIFDELKANTREYNLAVMAQRQKTIVDLHEKISQEIDPKRKQAYVDSLEIERKKDEREQKIQELKQELRRLKRQEKDWLLNMRSGETPGEELMKTHARIEEVNNELVVQTRLAGFLATTIVDFFPLGVSPHNIYDMCGNVAEWTRNLWGGNDYLKPSYVYPYYPEDGRERIFENPGFLGVVRGGSFEDNHAICQCSARIPLNPDSRTENVGFRIVLTADPRL